MLKRGGNLADDQAGVDLRSADLGKENCQSVSVLVPAKSIGFPGRHRHRLHDALDRLRSLTALEEASPRHQHQHERIAGSFGSFALQAQHSKELVLLQNSASPSLSFAALSSRFVYGGKEDRVFGNWKSRHSLN